MKQLTLNDGIQILAANEKDVVSGAAKHHALIPEKYRNVDWLVSNWREQRIKCDTVCVDGENLYLIYWHVTPDNGIIFNACVAIQESYKFSVVLLACERIAEREKAAYMRGLIIRPGMLTLMQHFGWETHGVMMHKNLS